MWINILHHNPKPPFGTLLSAFGSRFDGSNSQTGVNICVWCAKVLCKCCKSIETPLKFMPDIFSKYNCSISLHQWQSGEHVICNAYTIHTFSKTSNELS